MNAPKGRDKGQWSATELTPWHELPPYGSAPSRRSAVFYCPNCGHGMDLRNHQIGDDGAVTPSVVENLGTCGECNTFHDNLKLEGWQKEGKAT